MNQSDLQQIHEVVLHAVTNAVAPIEKRVADIDRRVQNLESDRRVNSIRVHGIQDKLTRWERFERSATPGRRYAAQIVTILCLAAELALRVLSAH